MKEILTAVFGEKGLAGGVVDVLKSTGIIANPELELEITKALNSYEVGMAAEMSKQVESVNQTMRAEAASDKWPQYSWRPTIGFTFSGLLIFNYVMAPLLRSFGLDVVAIEIPGEVWNAFLVILGAAAATRGYEKAIRGKK